MDKRFSDEIKNAEKSWRNVVIKGIMNGVAVPAFSGSLAYKQIFFFFFFFDRFWKFEKFLEFERFLEICFVF